MIKPSETVGEQGFFALKIVQATDYRKITRTWKRGKTNEAK